MLSISGGTPLTITAADEDAALILATARGDRAAFDTLYRRYREPLQGFVMRTIRRGDLAEDVVSETMLVVWRSAGRFEGRSRARTWIFGVAYRCGLDALRRQRRSDIAEPLGEETFALADEANLPQRLADRESVAKALLALSAEQRAVIELAYYFGYSVNEIAEIVGCPPGTVKTRMFAARRRLGAILDETGGTGHA